MASLDELESRVERLERTVAEVRQDAAAARVLAGAADRDVSGFRDELRAQTRVLNALRETQAEQGALLAGLDRRAMGLDQRVVGLDQRVVELDRKMSDGFSTLNIGMVQIVALLRPDPDAQ
ncbi:MAG TPA: hypothetical protein VHH15_06435 [Actinophytocola sp.]|nr:hypothetical protein [Actinophytocola sp.]